MATVVAVRIIRTNESGGVKMRTAVRLLVVLCLLLLGATTAPAQTRYKPGQTVVLTVKFTKPLAPNSTVSVNYEVQNGAPPDETLHSMHTALSFSGTSSDNSTFEMRTNVAADNPSGHYVLHGLQIDAPNRLPGIADQAQLSKEPIIIVESPEKDPPRLTVPNFTVEVK